MNPLDALQIFAFILCLITLWYFIASVIVLFRRSVLAGILGIIFAPWTQLFYCLFKRNDLYPKEQRAMLGCVLILIACSVFGIAFAFYLPSLTQ